MRRSGRAIVLILSLAGVVSGGVAAVEAHGPPADLAFWGNFGRDTTRCQRLISRATARCVKEVLAARSACMADQVGGASCDADAVTARIEEARRLARTTVRSCTAPQLSNLRYLDHDDAINDVLTVCSQLDTAAISASFGPAMVGGSVAAVDRPTQRCIEVTTSATRRLLRYAIRTRQRTFDRIAAKNISPSRKIAMVEGSAQRIAHARGLVERQLQHACGAAPFELIYNRSVAAYLEDIGGQADCLVERVYVQNRVTCPPPVCGNGVQEPGEECDDGNDYDGDACRSDCRKNNCDVFPTTYDLVQRAIFENRGCTDELCHGSARMGDLDLRAGVSYESLVDVPSATVPGFKRIDPGNKDQSLLWLNLAAATRPDEWKAPLRAMPISGDALTEDELEALRLWIEDGGAVRSISVPQAGELLNACLPEPRPGKIEPLAAPPPGRGVQLYMPNWAMPAKSESEVCFSSYYDFTGQIPEHLLTEDRTHFRYKEVQIRQDPLSHHLIVDIYRGSEAADDPVWGPYSCKGGPRAGQSCNPLDLGFCGDGGACATDPDPRAVACIGFGPQTGFSTFTSGGFAFAQEATARFRFPSAVYGEVPVKGVVLWNSHAFNTTRFPGTLQAWVNIYFPEPEEQQYKQQVIFNVSKIFWTESFPPFPLPDLGPFEQMEVCNIHEFGGPGFLDSPLQRDQTAHVFELTSHTHRFGKRFQIFHGRFTCKGGANSGQACSPFNSSMCPQGACTDNGGRDAQSALLYTSLIYNDPVVLRFDPPMLIPGTASRASRSLTYCSLYDNGAPPNIQEVKRRSQSPPAGSIFGVSIGGPCQISRTRCIGGPHHGELCRGNDAFCDSSPGAGDGDCDACPLTGGFRTEDEMFILGGNYWVQ